MRHNQKIKAGVYGQAKDVEKCEALIADGSRYCRHYADFISLDLVGICKFHRSRMVSGERITVRKFDPDVPPLPL